MFEEALIKRPQPPVELLDEGTPAIFTPAHELTEWLRSTFIEGYGPLLNYEHEHLQHASIGCLWTNVENRRNMLPIVGQAEMPMSRGGWAGARGMYQLRHWFGEVPNFLITLYAPYAAEASDLAFCALNEHELYHCAQLVNSEGEAMFRKDETPIFGIRGHDVEEHVGIMRRYGVHACAGRSAEFVRYAMREPEIGHVHIAGACGTCKVKF